MPSTKPESVKLAVGAMRVEGASKLAISKEVGINRRTVDKILEEVDMATVLAELGATKKAVGQKLIALFDANKGGLYGGPDNAAREPHHLWHSSRRKIGSQPGEHREPSLRHLLTLQQRSPVSRLHRRSNQEVPRVRISSRMGNPRRSHLRRPRCHRYDRREDRSSASRCRS
jgi:hypothetical protein